MIQEFVHVHRDADAVYLVDHADRRLFLRGVNVNGLIQYAWDYQEAVPMTPDDFREMRAMGFNVIRLPISWSRIMRKPGHPDDAYLTAIRTVLEWAWAQQIYVIVDFHQDNYTGFLAPGQESDGAPNWATLTNPRWNWRMRGNPAVQMAWSHFWKNHPIRGRGLQDHYLDAVSFVANGLRDEKSLLAYDLMNEPDPGWAMPGYFETRYLFPFYACAIDRVRSVDPYHCILFEPSVIRDVTNVAIQCSRPFSSDPNLVYGPHCYTPVALWPFRPVGDRMNPCLRVSYGAAALEARGFGVPWLVGEFGVDATAAGDHWIQDQLRLQHQFGVGSAFWVWKQRPGFYEWEVVHADGTLRTTTQRAQILAQPRALALPGQLHRVHYDVSARTLVASGVKPHLGNHTALLYASGFTYSRVPAIELTTQTGSRRVEPDVQVVRYPPVPEVNGWEIRVDLAEVQGPYRIVMSDG